MNKRMNNKALKIAIGLLVAAILLVGGLAVAKNMGVFSNASANSTEEEAPAGGVATEVSTTPAITPGPGEQPDAGDAPAYVPGTGAKPDAGE